MKIIYTYHKEKRKCCDKENQWKAKSYFSIFQITGCGDNKKEAKIKLIEKIEKQPELIKEIILNSN